MPSDVIPVIEGLDIPFSQWVTARLREHAAKAVQPLSQQFEADAELAGEGSGLDRDATGQRMEQSAPW